jgi:hypothetical protein
MQISFEVGGSSATFQWSGFIGSAKMTTGDEIVTLQTPLRLSSQFDWRIERTWECRLHDHEVKVIKVRPRLLAGIRKSSFTVAVDGIVVASATGR